MPRATSLLGFLFALLLGLPAGASPPGIPDQVPYAGTISGGGSGPVDLTVRLYDAASGGTLLYLQSFPGVALTDGAFQVTLGPTGAASDSPANPLTTSLVAALSGDLAAGAGRFVELTVNSDPPLARTRVLAVPFALRAASSETAEVAAAVTQVGGVPPEVLGQIYANTNLDGGGPPNTDPSEGTGDVDGDGIANFVDADNDGDGYADTVELAQGSQMNLVTPNITGFSPPFILFGTQATVQVQGTGFEPGITVVFGSQTPTPTNVTPTQFDVLVGPQTGTATVTVTRLNGELDTASFNFGEPPSTTHSATAIAGNALDFDVFGASQTLVGGSGFYLVDTDSDGDVDATFSGFSPAWTPAGRVAALSGGTVSTPLAYAADIDGDFLVSDEAAATIDSGVTVPTAELDFDPSGRPVVAYLRLSVGTQAMVARDLTNDGDFADAGELVQVQSVGGQLTQGGELAIDASGRVAFAYRTGSANTLRIAYDRNGDGDFADTVGGTPEIAGPGSTGTGDCLGLDFDSAGRLAVAYRSTGGVARLGRDLNNDGDIADAGESTDIAAAAVCDVRRTTAGGLEFAYGGSGLTRLRDLDNDGNFTDPGESSQLLLPSTSVTALELGNDGWIATETLLINAP